MPQPATSLPNQIDKWKADQIDTEKTQCHLITGIEFSQQPRCPPLGKGRYQGQIYQGFFFVGPQIHGKCIDYCEQANSSQQESSLGSWYKTLTKSGMQLQQSNYTPSG
jgi:hypothetical protein